MGQDIKKYLKYRIEQSNKSKMDEERHKVDRVFFNGQEQAFQEVLNYLEGGYYIDRNGFNAK